MSMTELNSTARDLMSVRAMIAELALTALCRAWCALCGTSPLNRYPVRLFSCLAWDGLIMA